MTKYSIKTYVFALGIVVATTLSSAPASALLIGPVAGVWDGTEATQLGRIFRDGIASDGTGSKAFPGVLSPDDSFFFETFQFFNNGIQGVVTIDAIVSSTNTHLSAFLGNSYDTLFSNNAAKYLGDLGSSVSQSFSILAPANSSFLVVASTNFDAAGSFSFTVEGDAVSFSTPTAVPEPASLALFGLGLAGLGWSRRKKA